MHAPRVVLVKAIAAADLVAAAARGQPVDLTTTPVRSDEPTPAKADAGNYAKRVMPWRGLTIRIENEAGSVRRGDGWETTMALPYGYFVESMGVDGDPVDVYVGPLAETADQVFIVHQRRVGDWRKYDEDKAFIGLLSEDEARAAFLQHYDDPRFLGPITAMPVDEFVSKVRATKEKPKMIKSAPGQRPILFVKARDRRDTRTVDMFGAGAGAGGHTHMETITRKDGVVQAYHVTSKKKVRDPMEGTHTAVTLSNGKTHRIQRLNSTESMGLPGWHDIDEDKHSFLHDTEDGGLSLAEVALEAGYCSQAHMSRMFLETFGVSPGRFKRMRA